MSAYGDIKRAPNQTSVPPTWASDSAHAGSGHIQVFHLTLETARSSPGLVEYLGKVFAQEVDDGMTYPQEGDMNQETFEAYFFAADVFVGVSGISLVPEEEDQAKELEVIKVKGERTWEECIAGYYYIKPNYPGRSSHICNAGFVVPPSQRGLGYGRLLARSYVHYAPLLGYQASVFNLVYVNNAASVKLWEGLGFEKAGRIPRAGRLRTKDGLGEEYVDAWVFYKSFINN